VIVQIRRAHLRVNARRAK